jgi:hypothetical protein
METGMQPLHPRLSSRRGSILGVTSTLGILPHLPIRGRALVARVRLLKEVHKQQLLDSAVGVGVHLREAGCNRDKQAVTEEEKVLRMVVVVVVVRVRIQLLGVVARPEMQEPV